MPASEDRGRRGQAAWTGLALFLLLMARACAFGFQYWFQLDDYIQYHNYPLQSSGLWALHQRVGLLASRPLAGVLDYFLWGRMTGCMLLGVALVSLIYILAALLFKGVLERWFRVSPVFLVLMVLLPLGVEGTYWMSASTRIAVGMFCAALACWAFLSWLDRGGGGRLALYLALQLLPFGFYEQAGILSVTLTVGAAVLEGVLRRRPPARCAVSLWGFPAMGLYLQIGNLLSTGGVYSGRAELVDSFSGYYWKVRLPSVLEQLREVFLKANFYTLVKGFVRGVRLIFAGRLLVWALAVVALVLLAWQIFLRRDRRGGARGVLLPLLAGALLAIGPVSLFFVLNNPWFSLRCAVTSLPGLALMADTLFLALWDRLPFRWDGPAALAAGMALVFCVAGASEVGDYRDTYENDQRIAALTMDALAAEGLERAPGEEPLRVGILNLEASYLPNLNYLFHEHIHGCTESAWAFQGLLTSLAGGDLHQVSPLPSSPIYRQWNAQDNRPSGFDVLFYFDGSSLERVSLSGETNALVLDRNGEVIGAIWEEEDGLGYFRKAERLSPEFFEKYFG